MKSKIITACLFFCFSVGAAAQVNDIPLIGTGGFSCGKFIEYKVQNNPLQLGLITQWVWGFMSAYGLRNNFATQYRRSQTGNISTIPDDGTVLLFLEQFCRKNPLASILDGTMELIKESGGEVIWRPLNK